MRNGARRGLAGLKHRSRVIVLPILEQPQAFINTNLIALVQYLGLKRCLTLKVSEKLWCDLRDLEDSRIC